MIRRYLTIVQDAKGYPAPGGELEPAPPEGPEQPMIYSVVKADEHEAEMERLRKALREAVAAARLFNRNGMTWLEYDAELVRLEGLAASRERQADD